MPQSQPHLSFLTHCLTSLLLLNLLSAHQAAHADGNNWMASIDGRKTISELSIPGSHDAGARFEPLKGTTKCQSLTISEQLDAGVRFLDIRCHNSGNEFSIYHGPIFQKLTFAQVLDTVCVFLKANPTETVIMSVKEENSSTGATFATIFDNYVAKSPGIWYLKPTIPTLGAVRGKIVLFRRFAGNEGIQASSWADNQTFTNGDLKIEDYYSVPSSDAKWSAVLNHLNAAKTGSNRSLYISFASGFTTRATGVPDILAVSDTVNTQLNSYFQSAATGRYGIILLDFAEPALCAKVVATNPAKTN